MPSNFQKISDLDYSRHFLKFLSNFRLVFKKRVHISFYSNNSIFFRLFSFVYLFQKVHLRHKFVSVSSDKAFPHSFEIKKF